HSRIFSTAAPRTASLSASAPTSVARIKSRSRTISSSSPMTARRAMGRDVIPANYPFPMPNETTSPAGEADETTAAPAEDLSALGYEQARDELMEVVRRLE